MEPLRSDPREWEPEISLDGEIDYFSTLDVWHSATNAMDRFGPYVVLDLSGVTFIDVAGVGILVHVHEEAVRRGGRLTLASVPAPVEKLIRLTGLDHEFEFREP
jgi:anti-anti-sigma factor